jgi:two-component system sensor histidine kinase TtrS
MGIFMDRIIFTFILWIIAFPHNLFANDQFVKIGVLSHRGDAATTMSWGPTAEYLTAQFPDYQFSIIPLDFNSVDEAVNASEVDFILVNPGIYVNLEASYRVSRIATLNNRRSGTAYNVFGGVIFTRSDREDISSLEDLRGKSFMAVDQTSLGGFQMAWREFNALGINPLNDFSRLEFGGIHDHVVNAVIKGNVDAGTVRTDILERMAEASTLDPQHVRILHPQDDSEFPFAHSTRLYPEWPFSKVRHTSNELAQQVAIALLQMPRDHPAAISGNYSGWTIPLDYQPVHELFQELELPPYAIFGKFTLWQAVQRYWYWVLASLAVLLAMGMITSAGMRRNRQLAKAKRRLERRHTLILNSVADGIYGVDLKGNSTFVNSAMAKITGWSEDDLIGKNQHEMLHHTRQDGSRHPREECPIYATYQDNKSRFIEDDLFWRKDGKSISVEYSSTPIRDEHGETTGSVVVFRDITERKQIEEKFREHQSQLAHMARINTVGEIASGIAHELNQPLTAITTNSRACVRMMESGSHQVERCADVMEKIADQAERAGEIIRQIRHFVHKDQPQQRQVSAQNMLNTVIELIAPEAQRAGVKLNVEIDKAVKTVYAQEIQIEQVLLNLVRNAIEALRETPRQHRKINIRIAPLKAGLIQFSVSDSGPGLEADFADQIFNPFVTTKEEGMGLGLSISKGIIEAHQSELRVKSTLNGASFSFSLSENEITDD